MENQFRRFAALGYSRLIPITPPGAQVSERSSLFKRQKDLGKAPGIRGADGLWRGVDWMKLQPTDADFDAWHDMGAGVGLRLGAGLIAVDIDTLDPVAGDVCGRAATELLGPSPNRVGRSPKRAKLYRVTGPVPYQRVTFEGGAVEILTEGRQMVVHGVHPATGKPYEWPAGVPEARTLPEVTPQAVAAFLGVLAARLPAARQETSSLPAADHVVDPSQLAGRADDIRRAMAALPNDFPDRNAEYVRVGQALKGALPDDPELAAELFDAWAAKWPGYDADVTAADWRRFKPSRTLGAQYLFALADRHSGGAFQAAEAWFEATPAGAPVDLNPFDEAARLEAAQAPAPEPIAWANPDEWAGVAVPPREWEVEGWIPRDEVTLLYGEGGVGKTLITHQYAVCAAAGVPWLGQPTRQARVMMFACEDSETELQRRHRDICGAVGVAYADLGGRLRMVSRKYMDNLLAVWNRNTTEMRRTALWEQLQADVAAFGADVLIVDTLADTFGGSEIDRAQVNAFVKACLGPLARTVIALGHPSVGGRAEGRSGSTAWANAARSRLYLRYPKDGDVGDRRELEGTKTNYGPKGSRIIVEWRAGAFAGIGGGRRKIGLNAFIDQAAAEAGAAAGLPAIADVAQAAVLEALALAEVDGLPLNLSPRSSAYAPRALKAAYGATLAGLRTEDILEAIGSLERAGRIRATTKTTGHRNKVPGYTVTKRDTL